MWMQTPMPGGGHAMAPFAMSAGATEFVPGAPPAGDQPLLTKTPLRRSGLSSKSAAFVPGSTGGQPATSAPLFVPSSHGYDTVVVFDAAGWQQSAQAPAAWQPEHAACAWPPEEGGWAPQGWCVQEQQLAPQPASPQPQHHHRQQWGAAARAAAQQGAAAQPEGVAALAAQQDSGLTTQKEDVPPVVAKPPPEAPPEQACDAARAEEAQRPVQAPPPEKAPEQVRQPVSDQKRMELLKMGDLEAYASAVAARKEAQARRGSVPKDGRGDERNRVDSEAATEAGREAGGVPQAESESSSSTGASNQQASEPEGEPTPHDSACGVEPCRTSREDLLSWHSVVLAEGLQDEAVRYRAEPPERLAEPQEPDRGGGGARASRQQPSADDSEAGGGWRDDARRAQNTRQRDEADGGGGDWRSEAARAQREARAKLPSAGGKDARGGAGGSWRAPPAPALESSPTSWAAKEQARKQRLSSDDAVAAEGAAEDPAEAEVLRAMKAILNKLTIERFDVLYKQLLQWPKNVGHVEILIREVFEKATTQHHFVGMYAELCARLHQWFVETKICGDDCKIFRRVLLNRCQLSFEQTLRPVGPSPGGDLGPEAREEAELLHKTRMLGNLRLVGALLEKGMLASKVLVAVTDELLTAPTPVSLECLSVFLTCVGATFDRPDWAYRAHLENVFRQVRDLSTSKDCPQRARFLLRDVLDLRASGWQNMKKAVRAGDGPTTLEAVHQKAEEELGEKLTPLSRAGSTGSSTPAQRSTGSSSTKWEQAAQRPGMGSPSRAQQPQQQPAAPARFDAGAFREELGAAMRELRGSSDGALAKLTAGGVPPEHQATELACLLARVAEEGSSFARCAGFSLAARAFQTGAWEPKALGDGLGEFFNDIYEELRLDIPSLPAVVREDLAPVLRGLVAEGLLEARFLERIPE